MSDYGHWPGGAHVAPTDPDFCVAQVSRDDLVALQVDAEKRGFATRWSSAEEVRRAVGSGAAYMRPLLRERRDGQMRSYRCLVMYASTTGGGEVVTFDVAPERLEGLPQLALNSEAAHALSRIFHLALNGVALVAKD